MIINPGDSALRLYDITEVGEHRHLRAAAGWAREYLCNPHPDLGRRGPVCPYAQSSIDRRRFHLALRTGALRSVDEVVKAVEPYRAWFIQLAPREEPDALHTTILIVFPDAYGELDLIDAAQRRLKDRYVQDGLMIGEFHDGPPDKPGLWNPDLRPLASPVPMLVIRHMVATDLPFLADDPEHVRAYRALFGDHVPAHLRDVVIT
ncbi:hypothetical protein Aph01nite_54740 [Acrocarpospora phusangensis]|uniref:DUF6875 domain-containing protein n=1 Tax=Acrocarpospora phusangensis TaxID=1070424 RepID=A0A919QDE2_9ACTN|nr:hypothetical protein [Acrocarpospora phusangensis]GIH27164.1 hypothetical protein Aph01nite_54740 [Acrocarpospora phusangensis]